MVGAASGFEPLAGCLHPAVQSSHAVFPFSPWNLPASHRLQMPVPVEAAMLPGRHCLHTSALELPGTGFALPTAQPTHAALVEAPSFSLYVPAAHCSKVMLALAAPTLAQNPPTGHGLQVEAPGAALNVPTGHGVQDGEPALGECEPRGQSKHITEPLNET